jgi:hypothetical protein
MSCFLGPLHKNLCSAIAQSMYMCTSLSFASVITESRLVHIYGVLKACIFYCLFLGHLQNDLCSAIAQSMYIISITSIITESRRPRSTPARPGVYKVSWWHTKTKYHIQLCLLCTKSLFCSSTVEHSACYLQCLCCATHPLGDQAEDGLPVIL